MIRNHYMTMDFDDTSRSDDNIPNFLMASDYVNKLHVTITQNKRFVDLTDCKAQIGFRVNNKIYKYDMDHEKDNVYSFFVPHKIVCLCNGRKMDVQVMLITNEPNADSFIGYNYLICDMGHCTANPSMFGC